MSRYLRGLLLFVAIAVAAHVTTIVLVPRALMWAAMHRIGSAGTNHIIHAPRADETQRVVVMPSPDFLYSYCVYDLTRDDLRIRASIPSGSYWSASLYDAQTNNFYAIDDRMLKDGHLDLLLVSPQSSSAALATAEMRSVRSPSLRGVVLFRSLIDRDERLAELDTIRRLATCEAVPRELFR